MLKCEKILIAGFSGSGKSSFLKQIASTAPGEGWIFDDLDEVILKNHKGRDISALVETHGWDKFRLWERQALEGWLKEEGRGVLALGGGTLSQLVFDLYSKSKKVGFIHLSASFDECWERLHLDGTESRPLVKNGKNELHRVFEERAKVFKQIPWQLENKKGTNLHQLAMEFWKQISL